MLNERQADYLEQRVRETLEKGWAIAVVGWRKNHHTDFTRSLPTRRVRFYHQDDMGKVIGEKVGLILFAKYQSHSNFIREKKGKNAYPIILPYKTIIALLEGVKDLLVREH